MISRRQFINASLAATAISAGISPKVFGIANAGISPIPGPGAFPISVFSKMLHWLDYQETANFCKALEADGVDLTVRPKGHVLPENVATDLPKAFDIINKTGLHVYSIVTSITSSTEPHAEAILKTAASLGIKHYRMGWINYDNAMSIQQNLIKIEKQLRALAKLNAKYKIIGEYQNHSGTNFGGSMWDLYTVLHNIDSPWLGSQYDIYHAATEAANSWPIGLELIKPFIKTMDVKDFTWRSKDGKSERVSVPLGQGNIDFSKFFATIKSSNIAVPISLHVEYDLGGAESGATTTTMSRDQIFQIMKNDMDTLRKLLI